MSRLRTYNHQRFDGGMTDSPRDTSNLTKLAYISHLDIYRDPNRMYVMPGYESLNGYDGDASGVKVHDIRNFCTASDDRVVYALGTKSDGTGSKVFQWNESTPDTEWSVASGTIEGADNLQTRPFLVNLGGFFLYPIQNSGFVNIGKNGDAAYTTFAPASAASNSTSRYAVEKAFEGTTYVTNPSFGNIRALSTTALTDAKSIGGTGRDLASGDYTVGVAQTLTAPTSGSVLLWDAASLLADQNVRTQNTRPLAIGHLRGGWVVAHETGLFENDSVSGAGNGVASASVSYIAGESINRLWEQRGFSAVQYTENDLFPIKGNYDGAVLFHQRIATNSAQTTYLSGVVAVGAPDVNSQVGVSLLLDTSSLGVVENAFNSGRRFYFAHSNDGSVSRLQRFDTGTYDVPATIETLIYGADSPYQKELNGISIVTENLPSGGSVVCSYRTDEDSAWVTMGTSNTVGEQKHNFTKAEGSPIGKFQEIQFRIVITGKVTVKNIMVAITETSDLPF